MGYFNGILSIGKQVIKALPGVPRALTDALGVTGYGDVISHVVNAGVLKIGSAIGHAGKNAAEMLSKVPKNAAAKISEMQTNLLHAKDMVMNLDNTNRLPAKVGVIAIKNQLIKLNNQLGNIIKPIDLSQKNGNDDFNKFVKNVADRYKTNENVLAHYKLNPDQELNHAALLALSVQPVLDTHLLGKQLSKFKTALAYIVLLDVFIKVDGIPDFFEKYIDNIELSGITLNDVEFLLSLVISLIMLDLDPANQEYGYKENDITKIPYVFNSFNIIFKHNYLADTILPFSKQKVAQHLKGVVKTGSTIYELFFQKTSTSAISDFNKMNFVKEKIIDALLDTDMYKNYCYSLFDNGELTLSKLLVYFIYELKDTIPGLSMFDLGIYKDIFDAVLIKTVKIVSKDDFKTLYDAHQAVLNAKKGAAKAAAIAQYNAEIERIRALGLNWKTTGQTGGAIPLLIPLIPIAASVGYSIYNYMRKYTAKAADMIEEKVIKNIAYVNPTGLTYKGFNDISKNTNNVIDIIESGKYPFISSLLLYIQLKRDISKHDRLLLFNNIACGAQPQIPPIITLDAVGFSEIATSITGLTAEIEKVTLQFTTIGDLLTIINIVFANVFTTYKFMGALEILQNCDTYTQIIHDRTITPITDGIYNYIKAVENNHKTIRKLFLLFVCYSNIYMLCTDYFKFMNPNAQLGENDKTTIKLISKRITLAIHNNNIGEIKKYIYDCINYSGGDNANILTFKIIKYCAYKYMLGKVGQAILATRMALLSSRMHKLDGGASSADSRNESFKSASGTRLVDNAAVTPAAEARTDNAAGVTTTDPEPVPAVPVPKKLSSHTRQVSKYLTSPPHKSTFIEEDKIAAEAVEIKAQDTKFINTGRVDISDKAVFYNIFVTELFKYNFGVSSSLLMNNMDASVNDGLFKCAELDTMLGYFNKINTELNADTSSIKFMVFE